MTTTYTVQDVIDAGHTLEPLRCIHCGHVGEVTFQQCVDDGQCAVCGEWQLGKGTTRVVATYATEHTDGGVRVSTPDGTLHLYPVDIAEELAIELFQAIKNIHSQEPPEVTAGVIVRIHYHYSCPTCDGTGSYRRTERFFIPDTTTACPVLNCKFNRLRAKGRVVGSCNDPYKNKQEKNALCSSWSISTLLEILGVLKARA